VNAKRTLWLVALFAACQVMAQQQVKDSTDISSDAAHTSIGNVNAHWLAPAQPADTRHDREPIEGLSPQAWTTTVGWHPGESAFPDLDGQNVSTEMPLVWFGHEPRP
jgi:hypothetical protein